MTRRAVGRGAYIAIGQMRRDAISGNCLPIKIRHKLDCSQAGGPVRQAGLINITYLPAVQRGIHDSCLILNYCNQAVCATYLHFCGLDLKESAAGIFISHNKTAVSAAKCSLKRAVG